MTTTGDPGVSATAAMTLQEAADLLGVHYMTAYRYVRTGRLAAVKRGATWIVEREAVDAMAVQPPAARGRGGTRIDYVKRLIPRLVAGDEAGAVGIIDDALTAGSTMEAVYTSILTPALEGIGSAWERGDASVAEEHRATVVTQRVIGRLGSRNRRRGRDRGTVVLGAAPGDAHGLPVALLGEVLRLERYDVVDLGADVPAESFAEVAGASDRLVAVGICATTTGNEPNVQDAIRAVRAVTTAPILLGGGAIRDGSLAARLGADGWAPDAASAASLVGEITAAAGGR